MKILIVSTLKRKVEERSTASRSRIIYSLASGLSKKGHEVSLLGTNDSQILGVKIIPVIERGWVDQVSVENEFIRDTATLVKQARELITMQSSFDIIHNHTYPEVFLPLVADQLGKPLITTIHTAYQGFVDEALSLCQNSSFIALSKSHQKQFVKTKIDEVIYNGIDTTIYTYSSEKQGYLLWLGRLSKAKDKMGKFLDPKGVRFAIKLAEETNQELLLAGAVEDMAFYKQDVEPHLNDSIKWIGPVSSEQALPREEVVKLMQGAKALLFPILWEEPFGLVMIEAMSCGTPVIAFNRGAVSEIVIDSSTGFVIDSNSGIKELVGAFEKLNALSTAEYIAMTEACRKRVEDQFSVEKMVDQYEKFYQQQG